MNTLLSIGQFVAGEDSGYHYLIESFLGAGTQGEVYCVQAKDNLMALKWYFPSYLESDDKLHQRLKNAIQKGSPNETFLWPLELVSIQGKLEFGYIMPLRPPHFKSIVDLMRRRVEPSFYYLITACINLSESFLKLHAKGLCYRDINFNNVFFNPDTGDILICDNDNVDTNGAEGIINGTPRFMAPECVRGDKQPTTDSDLFSLGVLLFYMLMLHHPLEGKKEAQIRCFDQVAMNKLYGTDPVFIFDPHNNSNIPIKGLHDNALIYWDIYPNFIRNLFIQSFTVGIYDIQHGRVRENEWRLALIQLRDAIMYCSCGVENFYDMEILKQGIQKNCWACHNPLISPPRLRIDNQIIMLNYNTQLYAHHTDKTQKFNFITPSAQVIQHPQDSTRWGLKNLTHHQWEIIFPDGTIKSLEPQRTVNLMAGVKINFGNTIAEIRV